MVIASEGKTVEMKTVEMKAFEVKAFHSRLLRVSLAADESRIFWERLPTRCPKNERARLAFEQRWFGSKSMARVKRLLTELEYRFEAYPTAFAVLQAWRPRDLTTRSCLCHWHLQFSDPMYRAFTGTFLEERRLQPNPTISRDVVARWVGQNLPVQWASVTVQRMASALITCTAAAGLCDRKRTTDRPLTYPKVTDAALAYWLYFLKDLSFEGTLLKNPYLASVGLSEVFLEQRLRQLPSVGFSRMGELHEFNWQYDGIEQWATEALNIGDAAEKTRLDEEALV